MPKLDLTDIRQFVVSTSRNGSKDFIEEVGKRFEVGGEVKSKERPKGNDKKRK